MKILCMPMVVLMCAIAVGADLTEEEVDAVLEERRQQVIVRTAKRVAAIRLKARQCAVSVRRGAGSFAKQVERFKDLKACKSLRRRKGSFTRVLESEIKAGCKVWDGGTPGDKEKKIQYVQDIKLFHMKRLEDAIVAQQRKANANVLMGTWVFKIDGIYRPRSVPLCYFGCDGAIYNASQPMRFLHLNGLPVRGREGFGVWEHVDEPDPFKGPAYKFTWLLPQKVRQRRGHYQVCFITVTGNTFVGFMVMFDENDKVLGKRKLKGRRMTSRGWAKKRW